LCVGNAEASRIALLGFALALTVDDTHQPKEDSEMSLPAWLVGPLFMFTGPLAIVFMFGFITGRLTVRQ
jgi:hypothetical protein